MCARPSVPASPRPTGLTRNGRSMGRRAMSYRVATVDELQDIAYRQDTHMRPVRHHLGISAFGTNAWTAAREGDRLMPEHAEDEGSRGALRRPPRPRAVRDRRRHGRRTRPARSCSSHRRSSGPLSPRRRALRCSRSAAMSGRRTSFGGWEMWSEFHPAYEAGDYVSVIERAREPVEASGYPSPIYNLACCEALDRPQRRRDLAPPRCSREGFRASVTSWLRTPTSIRFATSRRSASCWLRKPRRTPLLRQARPSATMHLCS